MTQDTISGWGIGVPMFIPFFLFLFIVFAFVFWIWMIIDCMKREDFKDKTLWLLIILLGHLIGAIIYYFVIKKKS